MDYSLDELKSRLKMSEVEVKITTSNGKKSRKNKTPVFRQQRRPSSGGEDNNSNSPKINEHRASSNSPESPNRSTVEEKRPLQPLINEPPLPPPPGGIKSYSDFMRSLAAKYNNNENGSISSSAESPFQPFKSNIGPPPPVAPPPTSVAAHPLLGLPSPFPFFSNLTDPKSGKNHLPPGLPPGFPGFDLHSTQALLNLARNSNFLQPANVESKKRPLNEALDLSPPVNNKKAKIELKADPSVLKWSVSDVCDFVASIDICKEYSEVFREHNIDGSALPLLTEDHLTLRLGLKLGPALKLRSIIAKKLGPAHSEICVHCAHCSLKNENAENNGINNSEAENNRSASRGSNLSEKN